ncbi:MAG: helix-turn-helix transcriptional regulator, partial [Burkholderiales bacterium]
MTDSVTDPSGAPEAGASNGQAVESAEQLAAIREKRGMGKGEVAQRLKLHPRQLDAIERGDWAALPGRAFVRGCVRSYGRLLGVDVEPLLKTIGGFAEAEELKPTASLHAPMPRDGGGFGFEAEGKGSRLWWAMAGVGAVIAVGLFFGRDGDLGKATSWIGSGAPPATTTTTAPSPAPAADGGTAVAVPPAPGVPLVPPPLVPAP